jgi:hypothetical protein
MYRIKDWNKFQHYKTGRGAPPWIKLYRDLLNDRDWFLLEPDAAKFLVSCWIIAAENDGNLPNIETLAFRYRVASKEIARLLSLCKHWIIQDDSTLLADCYQVATPYTETESENKKENNICSKPVRTGDPEGFIDFYSRYPRKTGRGKAVLAWRKAIKKADFETIMKGLENFQFSADKQFIPEPSSWLNGERWADETQSTGEPKTKTYWDMTAEERAEYDAEHQRKLDMM